jgi:hypothetical protein
VPCPFSLADDASFLEAEISLSLIHRLTDDHMVQERDLKNPCRFANSAGQPHISSPTRFWLVRLAAMGGMPPEIVYVVVLPDESILEPTERQRV